MQARHLRFAGPTLAVVLGMGCVKDPSWALPSERGTRGDATVTGEPAHIGRMASAPVLDGKLDDDVWLRATELGPFVQPQKGVDNAKSPVAGFARAGWDDQFLYLGFVVRDRSPASPFGRDDADPHCWEKSSAVEIMVQPGDPGDNREYYEIQVDVAGAVFDTRWDDYNTPITGTEGAKTFGKVGWSSQIKRAIFVQKGSFYSIEVALPWSVFVSGRTKAPPKQGDVWRMNLYSFREGQSHAMGWSSIQGQGNFHKSSRFGRIQLGP